jgi:inorganic pyrophosphatase
MDYNGIRGGGKVSTSFNVLIGLSASGGPVKYEADPTHGRLRVETFMMTSMWYPVDYGFVPDTLAPNGSPLDALVVAHFPIVPGAIVDGMGAGRHAPDGLARP